MDIFVHRWNMRLGLTDSDSDTSSFIGMVKKDLYCQSIDNIKLLKHLHTQKFDKIKMRGKSQKDAQWFVLFKRCFVI